MASNSRSRLRSKSSTAEEPISPTRDKASFFYSQAKRGQSFDLERGGRSSQLKEPLLTTDDDIELASPCGDVHSAPEQVESGKFRRRAKVWRRGMRLPKGRTSRRKMVNDKFIDSSSTKNTPHYVKHCASDNMLARARLRILRGVESNVTKTLSLLVLAAYIGLNTAQLVLADNTSVPYTVDEVLQLLELIFVTFFSVEVGLRIVGQGRVYFRRLFEVFDMIIVTLSTLLTIVYVLLVVDSTQFRVEGTATTAIRVISGMRYIALARCLRLFFWSRVMDEQRSIITYVRSKVSQNKRRYVDENFNLDLTYVTDRVIAMSFPASGSRSLYRNSIQEVGRFLDKMHFGHYRVYNLCSEREYDTSYFHNQVQRILIDDHNVPKFTDLVDFCEDAFTWIEASQKNVIVVHCKGGKGRTGTMISAWLVRSGLFEEARDSLDYFTLRRTDKSRGKKTQGVDTPSQSRYVRYYQQLIAVMNRNLPPPVALRMTNLTLHGISGLGRGDGSEWKFEVYLGADIVFECSLDTPNENVTQINFDQNTSSIEVVFTPTKPVVLIDDVKFKFYTTNRSIPTGSDKCHFYFWFHTTFIENNRFFLEREELDNLHKSKLHRYYPVGFAVEMAFERSSDLSGTYSIIKNRPTSPLLVD